MKNKDHYCKRIPVLLLLLCLLLLPAGCSSAKSEEQEPGESASETAAVSALFAKAPVRGEKIVSYGGRVYYISNDREKADGDDAGIRSSLRSAREDGSDGKNLYQAEAGSTLESVAVDEALLYLIRKTPENEVTNGLSLLAVDAESGEVKSETPLREGVVEVEYFTVLGDYAILKMATADSAETVEAFHLGTEDSVTLDQLAADEKKGEALYEHRVDFACADDGRILLAETLEYGNSEANEYKCTYQLNRIQPDGSGVRKISEHTDQGAYQYVSSIRAIGEEVVLFLNYGAYDDHETASRIDRIDAKDHCRSEDAAVSLNGASYASADGSVYYRSMLNETGDVQRVEKVDLASGEVQEIATYPSKRVLGVYSNEKYVYVDTCTADGEWSPYPVEVFDADGNAVETLQRGSAEGGSAEGEPELAPAAKSESASGTPKLLMVDNREDNLRILPLFEQAGCTVTVVYDLNDVDVDEYDGLVSPGGHNTDPNIYGAVRDETTYKTNRAKDSLQNAAIQKFVAAEKPVLGICRGSQILNVALGGTTRQDIGWHKKYREVKNVEGSWMYELYGSERVDTYHSHHQCVERMGEGLVPTAYDAEDGTIESFQHVSLPIYGIQWHPDMHSTEEDMKVFESFRDICLADMEARKDAA